MRVIPEKQEPDGYTQTEQFFRFVLVFIIGVLFGWILFH